MLSSLIDSDLKQIFEIGDFDVEAVFTLQTGRTLKARGFFTEESQGSTIYGVEIEAVKPSFICPTTAITDVRAKMKVLIGGVTYQVEKIEKTGHGSSVCYLKT